MNWEEACQILGISVTSTASEMRAQYLYKAQLLHPDKTIGLPENIRQKAEEELKRINAAYSVLSDPRNNFQGQPPKLSVYPKQIRFKDLRPGEKKTTIIEIKSVGGEYTKFWMDDSPASWLKVTEAKSTTNNPLPLEVTIEATGFGKRAECSLPIRLENEKTKTKDETALKIELQGSPAGATNFADFFSHRANSGNGSQSHRLPVLIGVCGRSCSGKGVVTESLASSNSCVLLLQSDYYFHERSSCTYKGYSCWEHIDCIDFDRLVRDVDSLRKGNGIIIQTPSWRSQVKVQISSEDLRSKKLIIVEGFLVFAVKQLVDLFDYKIFVDASDETILHRRTIRDGVKKFNYIHNVVIPASKEYEHIQKGSADVIIDGEKPKADVVYDVYHFLQQKLSGTGCRIGQSPWKVHPGDLVQDSEWHPIDFGDLKDWVKREKSNLDNGSILTGNTFRYRKILRTGIYETRLSTQCKPRIRRYTREST